MKREIWTRTAVTPREARPGLLSFIPGRSGSRNRNRRPSLERPRQWLVGPMALRGRSLGVSLLARPRAASGPASQDGVDNTCKSEGRSLLGPATHWGALQSIWLSDSPFLYFSLDFSTSPSLLDLASSGLCLCPFLCPSHSLYLTRRLPVSVSFCLFFCNSFLVSLGFFDSDLPLSTLSSFLLLLS